MSDIDYVIALKECITFLKSETYVCHALNAAYYAGRITSYQLHATKDMIAERLGINHSNVQFWLKERGIVLSDKQMKQYRRMWVDSMLAEFTGKVNEIKVGDVIVIVKSMAGNEGLIRTVTGFYPDGHKGCWRGPRVKVSPSLIDSNGNSIDSIPQAWVEKTSNRKFKSM